MIPKVSIIVPVYNVEKYIRRCIDSILAQTFTEFECILVDDCSPDKCPEICDEYAAKDSRIKVVHKLKNENTSYARKTGVEISKGAYIQFMDSDDWIESDMTERLYKRAINENLDIVYCDFVYHDAQGKKSVGSPFDVRGMAKDDIVRKSLSNGIMLVVWNKLYKRQLFESVTFAKCGSDEDLVISFQAIINAEKMGYEYSILYHYCYTSTSIAHAKGWKTLHKRDMTALENNYNFLKTILIERGIYHTYSVEFDEFKHRQYKYIGSRFIWFIQKALKALCPYGILKLFGYL